MFGHIVQIASDRAHYIDRFLHGCRAVARTAIGFSGDLEGEFGRGGFGIAAFDLGGDVTGELDEAIEPAAGVVERVVGGAQPDDLAAAGYALEDVREKLTPVQALPGLLVLSAAGDFGAAEHPVVLALDLVQAVPHGAQEVVIGGDDLAVPGEFNHRH